MTKVVDNSVFELIRAETESKFSGGSGMVFGLSSHGVDYVYDENNRSLIPDDVRSKVEAIRAAIISGEISVPIR